MQTQEALVKRYKEIYPKDTFQKISEKTGIQITRVFRIFNGSEMKLKEYQSLEVLINSNLDSNDFIHSAKECINNLSIERINYLLNQMRHSLKLNEYKVKNNTLKLTNSLQA